MNTCRWPLGNGEWLEFIVYDPESTTWSKTSGLYILAYADGFLWRSVYVGQTGDFSARPIYHERWDEARQYGATHVHALWVPLAANRDK